ncbi:hypothetical protein [Paracoccus sp. SCSIO 75233]|uniref:hypothetical protein n=1 Tax=Paracoccus sp. SCSIO 75233 TaxID=3017782 RepID=UPI0022F0C1B8|nr:hypothetical protein [Paracoccus sp. SCSIO 75233]WBU53504.1 hypothetical protein PAF12_01295 [Paracoccus sp. SCSIO 75233]
MELMREIEDQPESWPELQGLYEKLTPEAMSRLDSGTDWCWQRVEAYCCDRWTPRNVIWLVQGSGEWQMPLRPAVVESVETWAGDWQVSPITATPWGGVYLPGDANRITATVGTDNPAPPAVIKAVERLANYLLQAVDTTDPDLWATKRRKVITPDKDSDQKTEESFERAADHIARAMQYSGAADLLRPYRRVK